MFLRMHQAARSLLTHACAGVLAWCAGIWTLWLLIMELAVWAHVSLLRKTHLKPYGPTPKLSNWRLFVEDVLGYSAWTWLPGAFMAWLNPGAVDGLQWSYACPNLLALGYFCLLAIMPWDVYSYFTHRWMHTNRTAFRYVVCCQCHTGGGCAPLAVVVGT